MRRGIARTACLRPRRRSPDRLRRTLVGSRTDPRVLAAAAILIAVYGWVVFSHASRSVGGSDSSGYFNAAQALSAGHPVEPVAALATLRLPPSDVRLFVPLGYVPGRAPGTMAPFYPIGFPLHLVAAAALAGWSAGPFLVAPLAATASVGLLFLVARELGLPGGAALACAALLAVSPILAFQAVQLMSDTAATAWALATVLFALKSRRTGAWSVAAGLAFGIGVLVRPVSAILLLPVLFAIPAKPRLWALFAAGGAPAAAALFASNAVCYGSPLRTGYGEGGALADFAVAHFPARFLHYGRWIAVMMSPIPPTAWLLLAADRRRRLRERFLLLAWFGSFFLFYCFYKPYDAWWYTRFLLPGIPALILATVFVAEDFGAFARKEAGSSGARLPHSVS